MIDMTQTFQFQSSHQHIYSSATDVTATIGDSATSGTAVVTAIVITQMGLQSNITRLVQLLHSK